MSPTASEQVKGGEVSFFDQNSWVTGAAEEKKKGSSKFSDREALRRLLI